MITILLILASIMVAVVGVILFMQIVIFDAIGELQNVLHDILENSKRAIKPNPAVRQAVRKATMEKK